MINPINEQLHSFARGQLPAEDLTELLSKITEEAEPEFSYSITIDDVHSAFQEALKKQWTIDTFFNSWYLPLKEDLWSFLRLGELTNLDGPYETDADEYTDDTLPETAVIPANDGELMTHLMVLLNGMESRHMFEGSEEDFQRDLADLIRVIENNRSFRGVPLSEYPLTNLEEIHWILLYNDEDVLAEVPPEIREVYRRGLDHQASLDNVFALRTKGYACYGDGHPVYSCDWETARDCMLRLVDLTDGEMQAQSCNTLGYIYYYGRTNGGIPQYEEAYRYFTAAAFYGLYEATYKTADMLADGKGTVKSPSTAYKMISSVYYDSKPAFLSGIYDTQFADAAIRMGRCHEQGIGILPDLREAYSFYLEARKALELRGQYSDHYGDSSVRRRLEKTLAFCRKRMDEEKIPYDRRSADYSLGTLLNLFLTVSPLVRVELCSKEETTGSTVTVTFCRKPDQPLPRQLFVFTELSLCTLTSSLSLDMEEDISQPVSFVVDSWSLEMNKDGDNTMEVITFRHHGKPVYTLKQQKVRLYAPDR